MSASFTSFVFSPNFKKRIGISSTFIVINCYEQLELGIFNVLSIK